MRCTSCRTNSDNSQFLKENKTVKTCLRCREKAQHQRGAKIQIIQTEPQTPCRFIEHHRKFKRLNEKFIMRAYFPRHKYETKHLMVDIRDCRRPSSEVVYINYK